MYLMLTSVWARISKILSLCLYSQRDAFDGGEQRLHFQFSCFMHPEFFQISLVAEITWHCADTYSTSLL